MVYNRVVKKALARYPAAKKRFNVYYPAARQLASDVMYLKGLINSEPKYHIVQSANNFSYNGTVISLSSIPQGDDTTNRDGNMVLPRYLSINLLLGSTDGNTDPVRVRCILFRYWGEATSSTPSVSVSEILSTVGSSYAPYSHLNDDNTGARGDRQRRIEVLKSKLVSFDNCAVLNRIYKWNIVMNGNNKKKEHIKFVGSSTGEPVSGGLYILFISDLILSTEAKYQFESKLTFYDN